MTKGMEFRTKIDIGKADFQLLPCKQILLVGSCFAGEIGRRFTDNGFTVTVNPYGTMYNPASILHTVERLLQADAAMLPQYVFLTLGTNHVYRLKETGQIVDNCEKRPAALFQEEQLSVRACADYLSKAVGLLNARNPAVQVVLTVSPIRYRKYGYHGSQLSKAALLLAADEVAEMQNVSYFPAYELLMDELRDYRFYASDMLHPSEQAADYVWERLVDWCFSSDAHTFMDEWRPIQSALQHRPFHPDSEEYQRFMEQTQARLRAFQEKYTVR